MFPAVSISIATLTGAIAITLMRMRPSARKLQTICMFLTGTALAAVLAGIVDGWLVAASRWFGDALTALFGKLAPDLVPTFHGMAAALPWVLPAVLILVFVLQVHSGKGKGKAKTAGSIGGKSAGGMKAMTPWLGLLAPMAFIMVPWSQLGIGG